MVYQIPMYQSMSANLLHDIFFIGGPRGGDQKEGDFRPGFPFGRAYAMNISTSSAIIARVVLVP